MDRSLAASVERWLKAGLITSAQAEEIRRFEDPAPKAAARGPAKRSKPLLGARPAMPTSLAALVHTVVNPPFARRAPMFLSTRVVGFVCAALAAVALFAALITGLTDLLLAPGRLPRESADLLLQLVAAALGLAGGYLMLARRRRGKRLVVASLALDVLGDAIPDPRHLLHWDSLLQIALWALLYFLVVVSRFERQQASVA